MVVEIFRYYPVDLLLRTKFPIHSNLNTERNVIHQRLYVYDSMTTYRKKTNSDHNDGSQPWNTGTAHIGR